MSFIQYCQNTLSVPLQHQTPEPPSLTIPLSTDTFLLTLTNNQYQVYQIRNKTLTYTGQLPPSFVPSRFIEPIMSVRNSCVILANGQGALCRLDYREGLVEVRDGVGMDGLAKEVKEGRIGVEFRVLDQAAEYLVGWVKNIENMSCTFFVYDWIANRYSNSLNLGPNFFNLIISNLSQNFSLHNDKTLMKMPEIKFALVSEDEKKIWYNYIQLDIKDTMAEEANKDNRVEFILRETGKRSLNFDHCPKIAHLHFPFLYVFTNNKEGPFLIEINMESNSCKKVELRMTNKPEKGLIRKYLGIVDGKILFTVHNIMGKSQEIYCLPVSALVVLPFPNGRIYLEKLIQIENQGTGAIKDRIANVVKCTEGLSFHRYNFEFEKVAKLCLKENSEFQPLLHIESIYRIPKKYYYSQLAEQLNFSGALTDQILSLL